MLVGDSAPGRCHLGDVKAIASSRISHRFQRWPEEYFTHLFNLVNEENFSVLLTSLEWSVLGPGVLGSWGVFRPLRGCAGRRAVLRNPDNTEYIDISPSLRQREVHIRIFLALTSTTFVYDIMQNNTHAKCATFRPEVPEGQMKTETTNICSSLFLEYHW